MAVDSSARTTLWYLSFIGFSVASIIRVNLNIAIVSMVQFKQATPAQTVGELYPQELTNCTINNNDTIKVPHEGFAWDEHEQGMVLGSYFWLLWITQLPGAVLAQKYGGKKIFGLMQLIKVLCCFLMPVSAYYSIYALIFVRFIQGLVGGLGAPAMHTLAGVWIPPNERSTFLSSYLGAAVGPSVMYPLSGLIIDELGWEWVFYMSGILGVIWFIFWHFMAFDSPSIHPRISQEEKEYIMKSLNQSVKKEKVSIPWKTMTISLPVWIIIIGMCGTKWGTLLLQTQLPTYLRQIHNTDIKSTGLLSGVPNFARFAAGLSLARGADFLLRNKKMSRTNVRKLFAAICLIGQAFFFLGVVVSGSNTLAVVVCITLAAVCQGGMSSGISSVIVDIAPNFAGILLAICNTVGNMTGFITPAIIGVLTFNNQTVRQWQKVLGLSAGIAAFCGIAFVLFGTAEVQHWSVTKKTETPEDLEPLKEQTTVEKQEIV